MKISLEFEVNFKKIEILCIPEYVYLKSEAVFMVVRLRKGEVASKKSRRELNDIDAFISMNVLLIISLLYIYIIYHICIYVYKCIYVLTYIYVHI
jgi:hypothetical protein